MNEPYLAIHIHNGTLFFSKKLPSESEPREILEIEVDEVISDDFDIASNKLGSTVLGILRLWHPQALHTWGTNADIADEKNQSQNDFEIAMHLISKSVSSKTRAYVDSIEALLQEQSLKTKAAHEFFNESWPIIRTRLEKFAL